MGRLGTRGSAALASVYTNALDQLSKSALIDLLVTLYRETQDANAPDVTVALDLLQRVDRNAADGISSQSDLRTAKAIRRRLDASEIVQADLAAAGAVRAIVAGGP